MFVYLRLDWWTDAIWKAEMHCGNLLLAKSVLHKLTCIMWTWCHVKIQYQTSYVLCLYLWVKIIVASVYKWWVPVSPFLLRSLFKMRYLHNLILFSCFYYVCNEYGCGSGFLKWCCIKTYSHGQVHGRDFLQVVLVENFGQISAR